VTSASGGDSDAWSEIVRRFDGLVWSVAINFTDRNVDAADITQTVWLRLAQHIGRITNPDGIKSWLALTTRNECFRLTKQRARTTPFDVSEVLVDRAGVDELSRLEEIEQSYALWEAFLRLPNECQALLHLLNTDPPTAYVEVADKCGIAVGSIGPRRQRCLSSLRVALRDHPAIG
jgi:RNA polymerase sigma factor (sigma-70 family)